MSSTRLRVSHCAQRGRPAVPSACRRTQVSGFRCQVSGFRDAAADVSDPCVARQLYVASTGPVCRFGNRVQAAWEAREWPVPLRATLGAGAAPGPRLARPTRRERHPGGHRLPCLPLRRSDADHGSINVGRPTPFEFPLQQKGGAARSGAPPPERLRRCRLSRVAPTAEGRPAWVASGARRRASRPRCRGAT
jgi:hypothetical protein